MIFRARGSPISHVWLDPFFGQGAPLPFQSTGFTSSTSFSSIARERWAWSPPRWYLTPWKINDVIWYYGFNMRFKNWLVVLTILKNISLSMGRIISYIMEHKRWSKPPTSLSRNSAVSWCFFLRVFNVKIMAGWWLTYPSEKYEFLSWDDYSKLNGQIKTCSKPPIKWGNNRNNNIMDTVYTGRINGMHWEWNGVNQPQLGGPRQHPPTVGCIAGSPTSKWPHNSFIIYHYHCWGPLLGGWLNRLNPHDDTTMSKEAWSKPIDSNAHHFTSKETCQKNVQLLHTFLVGGWPTPPKNHGVRQLGWLFHSQLFMESHSKFHGSSHHQADSTRESIANLSIVYILLHAVEVACQSRSLMRQSTMKIPSS